MSARPQHAQVALPGLGRVAALVEVDGARATAALLSRPTRPLTGIVGEDVAVHITTGKGVLRLDARIAAVPGPERMVLDVHARHEIVQRRSFARVNAFLPVVAEPGSTGEVPTAIVNISAAGAVISHLEAVEPGDSIELTVTLDPTELPVRIGARVVRRFEDILSAVHFERLDERDRERIVRFVMARQREERKFA